MVLFHTPYRSERLTYVLDYVFKERFGLNYTYETEKPDRPVQIAYGGEARPGFLHFTAQGLLGETGFNKTLDSGDFFPVFKPDADTSNTFPDIFSALFYHLTRYEEYGHSKDKHGRFEYQNSCLYQKDLLLTPIIDFYLRDLKILIQNQFQVSPQAFKAEAFYIQAGIDIDSVFAYKGRPWYRQLAAFGLDLAQGRFHEIKYRFEVLSGLKKDPNENFELQKVLLGHTETHYFIQVGRYGAYDKNSSPKNSRFREIIRGLKNSGYSVGLHPSYQSNSRLQTIREEKNILEQILGEKITASRQHFLRFSLPYTYRSLIEAGIKNEFSMGYSERPGFRAGTAFPFYWYDLEAEQQTALKIYPFSLMDVAYKNFLKLNVENTCFESGKIKELCKNLNAPFHFVFHNESLSGHRGWENWEKVFTYWCDGGN